MKRLITLLKILVLFTLLYSCTNKLNKENVFILNNLEDKIYINIYLNGDLSPQFQKIKESVNSTLKNFQSISNKEIDFEYIFIKDDSIQKNKGIYNPLINLDLHPLWIKTNSGKFHKTYPYATVHFREKTRQVLLYNSLYYDTISDPDDQDLERCINNLEYNFLESFYLIQQQQKKKIAFLYGNGELDSTNTWDIRNTLSKFYEVAFFDLRSFEIDQKTQAPDITKQVNKINEFETIIIAKPSKNFLDIDKYLIDQYIMNGGKTLWLLEGTSAHMDNFENNMMFQIEKNQLLLEDYLAVYGATLNYDLIQDERCSKSPVIINNEIAYVDWQYNPILLTSNNHLITSNQDSILTNFASSIKITNQENTTVLLSSSNKSNVLNEGQKVSFDIIKNPPKKFEGKKIIGVLIEDEFKSAFSDLELNTNLKIKTKSKKNKMIIVSDGDIISNLYSYPNFYYPLGYYHYGRNIFEGNTNFVLNCIQYLCDDDVLIKMRNKIK